ncbi:MAG: FG-GAP repeat domain-containing protein [Pirellulales bacterium]
MLRRKQVSVAMCAAGRRAPRSQAYQISRWPRWCVAAALAATALLARGALGLADDAPGASQLATVPIKIQAGGEPINVEVGHAAPFVADFDGDGLKDLLVGQFGGGKLRIYANRGTNSQPRFEDFTWFEAGGATGSVPSG